MKAALWLRVSTEEQTVENQRIALERLCKARDIQVAGEYGLSGSAWKGDHWPEVSRMLEDGRRAQFDTIVIWALDRLDRGGIRSMVNLVHEIDGAGLNLISLQEPWLELKGPMRDLILSIMAWAAAQESQRKSERNKAAVQRRIASGQAVGRQPGAKDKAQRKRSGYFARWERERAAKAGKQARSK